MDAHIKLVPSIKNTFTLSSLATTIYYNKMKEDLVRTVKEHLKSEIRDELLPVLKQELLLQLRQELYSAAFLHTVYRYSSNIPENTYFTHRVSPEPEEWESIEADRALVES